MCVQIAADSRQAGGVFCCRRTNGERMGQSEASRYYHEHVVQEWSLRYACSLSVWRTNTPFTVLLVPMLYYREEHMKCFWIRLVLYPVALAHLHHSSTNANWMKIIETKLEIINTIAKSAALDHTKLVCSSRGTVFIKQLIFVRQKPCSGTVCSVGVKWLHSMFLRSHQLTVVCTNMLWINI